MSKYLKNKQKFIHLIPSLPLLFSFSWLITMFANKRSLCVKTMGLLQEVFSFSSSISTSAAQVILNEWCNYELTQKTKVHSNLAIRNGLVRNKLVLRNHFLWPICHLLHKDKELLALNNFRATKKFLIAKFDCIIMCLVCLSIWKISNSIYEQILKFGISTDLPRPRELRKNNQK